MIAAGSSVAHGLALVLLVGVMSPFASLVERATLLTAAALFMFTSLLMGVFCRTVVVCRTFHSSDVEWALTTKVLPVISTYFRVVTIENKNHPDSERRYSPHAMLGMILGSITMYISASKEIERYYNSYVLLFLISLMCFVIVDRVYYFAFNSKRMERVVIDRKSRLDRFSKELLTPRWSLMPHYVKYSPRLRNVVFTSDQYWYDVIAISMLKAKFVIIDVTEVGSSKGLTWEIKTALRLISEGWIHASNVMFICSENNLEKTQIALSSEIGDGVVSPFPIGRLGNADSEATKLYARAHASLIRS